MGPLEQALFDVTTPLIVSFEAIMVALSSGLLFKDIDVSFTKDFTALLFRFLKHFRAWKVPDEAKLVARIKNALLALYEAQVHLPADEDPESKLNVEFRSQIWRLRGKLAQIAGEKELSKFDEGRVIQPPCQHPSDFGSSFARMSNERLAHELLLDPEFQLDDDGDMENDVFRKIRMTFHAAFWNSLVNDLRLEYPCYVRVLRVIDEIRSALHDITREHDAINECMDMVDLKNRMNGELFSLADGYKLVENVLVVIKRAQSPKRDAETAQLFAVLNMQQTPNCPAIFCKGLEFLLDRANAMRIDAANARLRLIAPVIRDHGIDYERGKFKDKIDAGQFTLAMTTAWLHGSMDAGESDLNSILTRAMLDIVSNIDPKKVPETLVFDADRLGLFHKEFSYLASSAAAIIRIRHLGGNIDNMSRMLADKVDVAKAVAGTLNNEALELEVALQSTDKKDSIYKLMGCRIRFQYSRVIDGGVADPKMMPIILRDLFPLITQSASKVKRVLDINKEVHGETYAAIVNEHVRKRKPTAHPRA